MSKKQNRKLDILSGIADDIIDSATAMRIKLIARLDKKPINTKRIFATVSAIAAIFILAITSVLLILNSDTRQIPVYTGMTASNERAPVAAQTPTTPKLLYGSDISKLNFTAPLMLSAQNNGNHYGNDKGNNNGNGNASDLNPGQQQEINVKKGEDFYITVHIDNPDNFEILSFTLNGVKYSSYMFEEGSDMENLVLKCTAGSELGVEEYTIDAIKYIDGTQIKDVIINGSKTIKIGVFAEGIPSVSTSNVIKDFHSIALDLAVSDVTGILAFNDYTIFAELYMGETLIENKALTLGTQSLTFSGLEDGVIYTLKVTATYDAFDGTGTAKHELKTQEFEIDRILILNVSDIGISSANLSWIWNEGWANKAFTSVALYKGETKVRDITVDSSLSSAELTGLLSNTEYTVVFEYSDGDGTASRQISFKTVEAFAPEITVSGISTPTATRKRIDFTLNISDVSNICNVTKIELWMDDAVLKTLELKETYSFSDINIYGKYSLKIYYEYDVCDGNGNVSKTQSFDFEPYTVYLPEPSISSATIGNNYVQFMLNITSYSVTGNIEKIEFYDGEKLIGSSPVSGTYSFYGLEPLKKYTVRTYFSYDVGDGISKGTTYKDLSIGTQSEGLAVSDGSVTGVGTNKDKVLYINMPIKNDDPISASYNGAFMGNTNITAVYMGSGVTLVKPATSGNYEYYDHGIAQNSFKGCTNLKTVVLPNTITAILANTFQNCTSLETITIPENLLCIMNHAFAGTGIKYVYIHEALDDLRANAFSNDCILLYEGEKAHENWQKGWDTYRKVIYNVASVENVGGTAYAVLKDGSKVSLDVPYVEPNTDIPMPEIKPEPAVSLENVKYGEKTLSFDCLLYKNDVAAAEIQKLELYLGEKLIETAGASASYSFASLPQDAIYTAKIYVSYKLTGSGDEAPQTLVITKECIKQSDGLKIENGWITGIGTCEDTVLYLNMPVKEDAFRDNANITAVYMGSGVSYRKSNTSRYEYLDYGLEAYAFSGCTNLEKVILPNTITAVCDGTFYGCTSLETIVIPENVPCILPYAFKDTGIKYVYIHEALDDLHMDAFDYDCVLLCEGAEAHPLWQEYWNTYEKVIFSVAGIEEADGVTYAVLKDGSKVAIFE